jgi:hypothetical protein
MKFFPSKEDLDKASFSKKFLIWSFFVSEIFAIGVSIWWLFSQWY